MRLLLLQKDNIPTLKGLDIIIDKKLFILLFLLIVLNSVFTESFNLKDQYLLDRGYTRFDPKNYSTTQIFRETYTKIFQVNWMENPVGLMRLIHDNNDGFLYELLYVFGMPDKENLPNILTMVFLMDGSNVYGYYKKNLNLEGYMIERWHGEILVFY